MKKIRKEIRNEFPAAIFSTVKFPTAKISRGEFFHGEISRGKNSHDETSCDENSARIFIGKNKYLVIFWKSLSGSKPNRQLTGRSSPAGQSP